MRRRRERVDAVSNAAQSDGETRLLKLTTDLACAFVENNQLPAAQLGVLLAGLHVSLRELTRAHPVEPAPAVPVKKSIEDEFLICLEDGKKLRTLKRYLMSHHAMTPDAYRKKWRLPADYPMVAPAYARMRSDFARKSGLGRKSNARSRTARAARKPDTRSDKGE